MTVRVIQGHVLSVLASLPAKSVHVCVTSPPYWGLRAYGTPPQVWETGNECACKGEHEWGDPITDKKRGQAAGETARAGNTQKRVCPPETQQGQYCVRECGCEWGEPIPGSNRGGSGTPTDKNNRGERYARAEPKGAYRRRGCGAWRGELGSEPTLDLFVAHLVAVFAAVGRVLRDDGTLWVNLGDSYVSNPSTSEIPRAEQGNGTGVFRVPGQHHVDARAQRANKATALRQEMGLKQGDLCMAPARFALAMQAAGWRLRSEITLCKTAPMPESVTGSSWQRCRMKVAKAQRGGERGRSGAVEGMPWIPQADHGADGKSLDGQAEWADCPGCPKCADTQGLVQRWGSGRPTSAKESLFIFAKGTGSYYYDAEATRISMRDSSLMRLAQNVDGQAGSARANGGAKTNGTMRAVGDPTAGRNAWNWMYWHPEPSAHAHYAAYPRFLPRLAIQAGTSEAGVCPDCGAPWLRVLGEKRPDNTGYPNGPGGHKHRTNTDRNESVSPGTLAEVARWTSTTLGWWQSCSCPPHQPSPSTVLDCFGGSGTTGIEANALGRHAVLVELQERYVQIAHKRLSGQPLSLFAHEGAAEFAGAASEAAG